MPTAGNDDIGELGDGIAGIRGVDWVAPTGAEAIAAGRTSWKWEQDDEDLAVLKRLGTSNEIMSWPGVEPYIVNTEADEARAQSRKKKARDALRSRSLAQHATVTALALAAKEQQRSEWARRQREWHAQQLRERDLEKQARRKAFDDMRHDWARDADPGYGADRWLWPKAMTCPRTYVTAGGDVAIQRGSRNVTLAGGGPGAALGIPLDPRSFSRGAPTSPPSPESPL